MFGADECMCTCTCTQHKVTSGGPLGIQQHKLIQVETSLVFINKLLTAPGIIKSDLASTHDEQHAFKQTANPHPSNYLLSLSDPTYLEPQCTDASKNKHYGQFSLG